MLYIPEIRRTSFWQSVGRFLPSAPSQRKKRIAELALRHMSEHMQRDLGMLDGNHPYQKQS